MYLFSVFCSRTACLDAKYVLLYTTSGGRLLMKKKLPIGIESFEELSQGDFYYVDKTMFIRELLRSLV